MRLTDFNGNSALMVWGDTRAAYHNHVFQAAKAQAQRLGLQVGSRDEEGCRGLRGSRADGPRRAAWGRMQSGLLSNPRTRPFTLNCLHAALPALPARSWSLWAAAASPTSPTRPPLLATSMATLRRSGPHRTRFPRLWSRGCTLGPRSQPHTRAIDLHGTLALLCRA